MTDPKRDSWLPDFAAILRPADDHYARRRTQALEHSIDMLRRGVSALGAASNGEPREGRRALLDSIHDRLQSMLAELKQLT